MSDLDRLAYSVEETAHVLGTSTYTVYKLVREGVIPSMRVGRRVFIPVEPLKRMLDPRPSRRQRT